MIQIPYTLGPDVAQNPYHLPLIQKRLVRNAPKMFDDIRDEVVSAFSDEVRSGKGARGKTALISGAPLRD